MTENLGRATEPEPAAAQTQAPASEPPPAGKPEQVPAQAHTDEPEPIPGQASAPALVIERQTELLIIIELIQKRIRTNQPPLSQNRKRTEPALIHPLSDLMDWDTSDPDLVIPECYGKYHVLIWNSRSIAMLATRALHKKRAKQTQYPDYCKEEFINCLIETDVDRWQVKKRTPPPTRNHNAHLTSQTAPEAAGSIERLLRAIDRLWRR